MNDIKTFAENEQELDILIQTMKIYSQDVQIELDVEKFAMSTMKRG